MKPVHVRRTETGQYVAEVEGVDEKPPPTSTAGEALRQAQQVAGEISFAAPAQTDDLTIDDSAPREVAAESLPSPAAKAADAASPSLPGVPIPVSLTT